MMVMLDFGTRMINKPNNTSLVTTTAMTVENLLESSSQEVMNQPNHQRETKTKM
jgi:hypothetical protein